MIETPTIEQAAAIDYFESGTGDAAVIARAGSGKTSTILHGVQIRPNCSSATLCAFNKAIAKELQARTKGWPRVYARTLHGLGMRAVNRAFGGRGAPIDVDQHREQNIAREILGDDAPDAVILAVARLSEAAKESAPDEAQDPDAIERVGADQGLLPSDDDDELGGVTLDTILRAAAEVSVRSVDVARDRRMSYSDMLYVPLAARLRPEQTDLVVVDEAQDMNLAQLRLAARIRAAGGRFVVVGDPRQAIYSFRGAAPGGLERVRDALKARTFKLTVTHRCATSIVEEARRYVPDLQAAPGAPAGIVRRADWPAMYVGATPGDFVLSRTNAMLAIACLRLLRHGVRAIITGGKLGEALIGLVGRLSRGAGEDLLLVLTRLEGWRAREITKAETRKSTTGAQAARDRADTIAAIADDCDTVSELRQRIADLFVEDGRGKVVCSTVHRAKGLEAHRVWMLADSFDVVKPRTDLEQIEEENLKYVSTTRAQRELVYIDGMPKETT